MTQEKQCREGRGCGQNDTGETEGEGGEEGQT